MRQKFVILSLLFEWLVKSICCAMWWHYFVEEKICIVLDGFRGEFSIVELCRWEGIVEEVGEGVLTFQHVIDGAGDVGMV